MLCTRRSCSVLLVLGYSQSVWAAANDLNIDLSEIVDMFVYYILDLRPIISEITNNLIFYLGIFTITIKGISLIYKQGTLMLFAFEMVKLIMLFGLTYFALHNCYEFTKDLVDSFVIIIDSYTNLPSLNNLSLDDFFKLLSAFAHNFLHKNTFLCTLFMFVMYICIGVLLIQYALSYLSLLLNLVLGTICIACISFPPLRFVAYNFMLHLISGIVHFCSLCLMLRIIELVTSTLVIRLNAALLVGNNITVQNIVTIITVMAFLCFVSYSIPKRLANVFNNLR